METGEVGCMKDMGVTECFRSKEQALFSASEASEMIIRVDDIIKCAPRGDGFLSLFGAGSLNPVLPPETLKAFFVVGLLFPLHIILGLLSPILGYALLSWESWVVVTLCYLPFYLYPAQCRVPGWRGFEAMWQFFDYDTTCSSYFGEFGIHGGKELDPDQQYCVACHPHGTVIFQRMFWRGDRIRTFFRRNFRMIAASVLFRIPIVREMSLLFGAMDCSRPACHTILKKGMSLVLWPGGLDESNGLTDDDSVRLRTRSGFVRLAVEYGTPIVPVFTFGELECVSAWSPWPTWVVDALRRRFRVSTALFVGRWGTFLPRRVPLNMCIGPPITVRRLAPTEEGYEEEVAVAYKAYRATIARLYEDNKEKFGYQDRALVFECEEKKSR